MMMRTDWLSSSLDSKHTEQPGVVNRHADLLAMIEDRPLVVSRPRPGMKLIDDAVV